MAQVTYADAGVDIQEGAAAVDAIRNSVHSTYRPEVIGDIGGFGGLFSARAFKNMEDPVLISGTDGVGTKLQLAQLCNRHHTVGIDLVAMCVNDILAAGAEPLFFLDYIAVGRLRRDHIARVVEGIAEGCRQAGCALIGGEMAEHPGVMPADDYDLSGFCVGVVDRPAMLGPKRVQEGDVLIGLASSGLHSNGYSLARRVLTEGRTLEELSCCVEALGNRSVLDALLEPTRIYVKPVLSCIQQLPEALHALAHITGGGITENLNRALPEHLDAMVELGSLKPAPIITYATAAAGLNADESLKTFNMGVGMTLIVAPQYADEVIALMKSYGEHAFVMGRVIPGTGAVAYSGECSF